MSLAGLPPHISNQEYNSLFVATSNIATALELAAPVVEELNILSTSGFFTFDYSLQEDVLVFPVILMFLGDSPMHAEINSTLHPNVKPNLRSWIDTKKNAYHTWYLVQRGAPKTQVQSCISEFGVKYVLNLTIIHTIKEKQDTKVTYNIRRLQDDSIEKLFNPFYELKGFDGHKDTPVEVLHVILLGIVKYLYCDLISGLTVGKKEELVAQFQSFEISNLNIPSIKAKYLVQHYSSLVGKDFKIIIQAAPFPKFHILLHLSQSVAHFGPASLFATEKFESYNGVDIANSFMSFSAIRYCLSGGNCISETNVSIVSPSYQVKNLLLKNPTIQNLLGLDSYIFKVKPRLDKFDIPMCPN
ncbi:hypothetical protein BY996DRAFT_6430227 [Phakopsora pachyrhizi]|nr:hypothetical protein BY996DRAFT_6430227 [Phakopsora pachyrhizi]